MIFANVYDIVIPEGNVVKIHETNSGRVLWEKKSVDIHPYWEVISSYTDNSSSQPILVSALEPTANPDTIYLIGFGTTRTGRTIWGRFGELRNVRDKNFDKMFYSAQGVSYPAEKSDSTGSYSRTVWAITKIAGEDSKIGVVYFFDAYTNSYYFVRPASDSFLRADFIAANAYAVKTLAQKSDYSVRISHSPERNEYLVTGLSSGRSCILPSNFTSSTALTYQTAKPVSAFINSSWCPALNSYYAANGNDKKVYYSNDGISWNSITAVSNGSVFDVLYLSKQKKLCAISNNQVALSADGFSWSQFDVPFSDVYLAAYSDDTGYLVVLNNKMAYVTYDCMNWTEADLPSNRSFKFINLRHLGYGLFIATRESIVTSTRQGEHYKLSIFPITTKAARDEYILDSSI